MSSMISDGSHLNEADARKAFADGYDEVLTGLGRFNLAIVGDTGVGKSSLVNAIFGESRAKTGIGAPITKGTDYHVNGDGTLGVWDFEGFEHGTKLPPIKTLKKRLRENQQSGSDTAIHVAWFCLDASGARLTDGHRALIDVLTDAGIPVIGVVTKVHARGTQVKRDHMEFVKWLQDEGLPVADPTVYPTASVGDDEFGLRTFGLQELLDATIALAPTTVRDAARQAQVIDMKSKRALAWKWISGASASAATAAAVPVPIASALILAPIQLSLFGKLAVIYGTTSREMLGTGATFQFALQLTGKATAQSLIKFVPGVGSVINATVASVWTAAAGEVWRLRCEKIAESPEKANQFEDLTKIFGPAVQALFKSWITTGIPKSR